MSEGSPTLRTRSVLPLRRRSSTYTLVLGVAIGMLLAGLVIPLAFGSRDVTVNGASSPNGIPEATLGGQSGAQATAPGADLSGPNSPGAARPGTAQSGSSPSDGTAGRASSPAGSLTASDVGVTPTTINVGVVLVNLAGVQSAGIGVAGQSVQDQQQQWQAFIDDINSKGGLLGRRINPFFQLWNPLDDGSSGQAACTHLTEDNHVFAVLTASFDGPPVLCVTQQHSTPLIDGDGGSDEDYQSSSGLLWTTGVGKTRILRIQAAELARLGTLNGKKLGILTSAAYGDDRSVKEGLIPTLNRLGYNVAHVSDLSADYGTGSSQIPLEVRQMQAAGVQAIFLATNNVFSTNFAQQADAQGFRPMYLGSDFDHSDDDLYVQGMPGGFQGVAITTMRLGEQRIGAPEPPADAACRQLYESKTGKSVQRGQTAYTTTMFVCDVLDVFSSAVQRAGPGLTRRKLSAGLAGAGAFSMPFSAGASFGPTKFDAPDASRTMQYNGGCHCWMPSGNFAPTSQ